MSTPEIIPGADDRQLLVSQIGELAFKTEAPDPELYAMMYLSTRPGISTMNWRHLRNTAAVQYELVTNTTDLTDEEALVIRAIGSLLRPQINRLRKFKEGWHYSSPAFRTAFEDVCALQQKHYLHDRPSKKLMAHHENSGN
jgi:hypothetical protein